MLPTESRKEAFFSLGNPCLFFSPPPPLHATLSGHSLALSLPLYLSTSGPSSTLRSLAPSLTPTACMSFQPYGWHHQGQDLSKRKLLQSLSSGPYSPLSVVNNGNTCILFKAKRLAIRYKNHTFVDLTEKTFGPGAPVDTKGAICTKEKAT